MANLSFFAHDYGDHEVRVTADRRFSVYDVLVAFGVCNSSDVRMVFKRIADKHPGIVHKIDFVQFPGRGQRETPVATHEVCLEILSLTGKGFGKNAVTSDKFYPRTEAQIVKVLAEAFSDCEPCPQFYCSGYRIDLYLAKYRIAIECDEYGHAAYQSKDEKKREQSIKAALGCSFVRFDPYNPEFNIGKVIKQVRNLIAKGEG